MFLNKNAHSECEKEFYMTKSVALKCSTIRSSLPFSASWRYESSIKIIAFSIKDFAIKVDENKINVQLNKQINFFWHLFLSSMFNWWRKHNKVFVFKWQLEPND